MSQETRAKQGSQENTAAPPPAKPALQSTPPAPRVTPLLELINIVGGLEVGHALANAAHDSSDGGIHAPTLRPSTTVTGHLTIDGGRWLLTALGGGGVSREHGGFVTLSALVDLRRRQESHLVWQLGADYTIVQSPGTARTVSGGGSLRLGSPHRGYARVRRGVRWRAAKMTSITTLELSHSRAMVRANTVFTTDVAVAGSVTHAPTLRGLIVFSQGIRQRERMALGDMGVGLQAARGAWAVEGRMTGRLGRTASVWDDPMPRAPLFGQSNTGKLGTVGRVRWAPVAPVLLTAEVGQQLSDPVLGLSGGPYASLSLRMQFAAGRRPSPWRDRHLRHRSLSPDAGLSSARENAVVVSAVRDQAGQRLLQLRDLVGEHIEIASAFTQWQPVALARCPDPGPPSASPIKRLDTSSPLSPQPPRSGQQDDKATWCGAFALSAGVHPLVYRSNGGAWRVPPGLTAVEDSFGGTVGLLLVP